LKAAFNLQDTREND